MSELPRSRPLGHPTTGEFARPLNIPSQAEVDAAIQRVLELPTKPIRCTPALLQGCLTKPFVRRIASCEEYFRHVSREALL